MSLNRVLLPVVTTVAALSMTTSCSSSHDSATTTHTANYCSDAASFLTKTHASAELENNKPKLKEAFKEISTLATTASHDAPNAHLRTSWQELAKFYTTSQRNVNAKPTEDEQSSMSDALTDATTRCHLDFRGQKSS